MNNDNTPSNTHTDPAQLLPVLVARVYEEAPPVERGRLLEHLLKPLGLLSLAAVANGIFAKITLSNGWSNLRVNPEDANLVDPADVIALVGRVQQVSVQALESLSRVITASPVLASSAAAAMLLTLLAKQATSRSSALCSDLDPLE